MWNPRKTLVLHNSRETLARLLNRRIWHLCTTYKMQNGTTSIPSMLCIWCSGGMIQDDQYGSMVCNVAMLWLLLTSFFALFLLKSLFIFFVWPLMRNAQTKIAIVYMREQSCDTRDDMIPRWYQYDMVCMQWKLRSLMCTSNVAGNTQWLVSIGKWSKMG